MRSIVLEQVDTARGHYRGVTRSANNVPRALLAIADAQGELDRLFDPLRDATGTLPAGGDYRFMEQQRTHFLLWKHDLVRGMGLHAEL